MSLLQRSAYEKTEKANAKSTPFFRLNAAIRILFRMLFQEPRHLLDLFYAVNWALITRIPRTWKLSL